MLPGPPEVVTLCGSTEREFGDPQRIRGLAGKDEILKDPQSVDVEMPFFMGSKGHVTFLDRIVCDPGQTGAVGIDGVYVIIPATVGQPLPDVLGKGDLLAVG